MTAGPRRHPDPRGTRLAGHAIVVAGAGSSGDFLGTGAATAVLLAAQGARVGVLDRDPARARHTAELAEDQGGTAEALVADVADEAALTAAVDAFAARAGRLDGVVANTAISTAGPGATTETQRWIEVLSVNLIGTHNLARAAHPHLVAGGGGSIVTVSSVAANRGFGSGAYGASKGGIQSLTVDLAYQWGRDGIRVNCLVPGHLHTPIGDIGGEAGRAARRAANLLGTEGDAWDVAWAALFLLGPESGWITAAVLPVDAGTTAATALGMAALPGRPQHPAGNDDPV